MEYKGIKLPENLVSTIYRLTIEKVGIYNGAVHSFQIPTLDTTEQRESEIRKVYDTYTNLDPFDFYNILNYVIDNVDAMPQQLSPQSITLDGAGAVGLLDHLVLIEESGAKTELIYVGNNGFYVLATSKSTILPGDVLEARKLPINLGEETSMNLYRDDNGRRRFIPAGCEEYDPAVKFSSLLIIYKFTSPEISHIIDREPSFGGELKTNLSESTLQSRFFKLRNVIVKKLETVDKTLSRLDTDVLPSNQKYPEYDDLQSIAMASGIPTYVLNTLIESIERRPVNEYCYVEDDWDLNLTPEQEKELEERKKREKEDAVKSLETELAKALKEVKTRRVGLFFKAAGKISNPYYLQQINQKLEVLADEGFGHPKGWAKQEIDRAVASSKPAPFYNLKVGAVLLAVIVLSLFTAYTWVLTKTSLLEYDTAVEEVMALAENDRYHEARANLEAAKNAFQPPYMAFIIYGKNKNVQLEIEDMIDAYVESTVSQIQIMREANWGRIDGYCWELIKTAMEFRPEDESLNELRNIYIAQ